MSSEFNFYQIDQTGESNPSKPEDVRTDVNTVIRRACDSKISIFGTNSVGSRMASDYTRTNLYFKSKDELADHNVITADTGIGANVAGRAVTIDHNPYVLGSTVKTMRDDQFFRMGMSGYTGQLDTVISGVASTSDANSASRSIDAPKYDVMDTNLVDASGMTSGKNWPSEGWRSFGGKYDFSYTSYVNISGSLVLEADVPYAGGGIH